ncbi:transcriptional regulator [Streptomyces sp. 549]|uniref:transcriptional regulator n=1 Tax=Streptomyces sp. 549 TaxID=3049076 RepID=UPI0024C42D9F|nr:transcriptional regulator [Streptomyces sp. 549]MDK1475487.1 transcriptional regulator [Streptomyces sp. 549]
MTEAPAPPQPTLDRLAAGRATGALLCDAGTLYLVEGEVVHAESPAAPGLDVLLIRTGRLPEEGWQEAVNSGGARCQVAHTLLDSGRLARGELELCHLAALYDAAYFVLAPDAGPVRFRSGVAHWLGPVRPVHAGHLEQENRRRRQLLHDIWPFEDVDTAPVTRREVAGGGLHGGHLAGEPRAPTPTRRQRDVLDLADGTHTPAAIARSLGRPAFHTLIDVRRLAAAGLIETPREPVAVATADVLPWAAQNQVDPDTALLRRIRDALEASL